MSPAGLVTSQRLRDFSKIGPKLYRSVVIGFLVSLLIVSTFSVVVPRATAIGSNLVKNGDFSVGLSDWTTVKVQTFGSYPTFDVVTDLGKCTPSDRVGNPFLSIVVPFGADGYVEQNVIIPITGAGLSFVSWGWENNDPIFGISGLVDARVAIVDASGTAHTLETFTPPPMLNPGDPNNSNDDTCTGNSPVLKSYDLSSFSGQTVKLRIGATSQNCCGTNALFDDISIKAATPIGSNLVKNGDFSGGLSDWTTVKVSTSTGVRGEYPILEVLTESPPPLECTPGERRGNPFLSIDAPFGADGYIEQGNLVIPAGARLSFLSWGWEGSNPELGFRGLVDAYARIVDVNGVEHTLETYTPPPMFIPGGGIVPDVCTRNGPVLKSYDLSAFSGQTVKLRIGARSQNCCGTNALFDDVVIATEAGTPSAKVLITASPGGLVSYAFAGGTGNIGPGTSKVISAPVGDSLSLTAAPSSGSAFSTWSFTTGLDTTFNSEPLDRAAPSVTPVINGNGMITAKFSSTPAVTNLLINANSSVVTEGPGSSSRITATVLDQYGMPISGVSVDFKSTKGLLSVPSSVTDILGHASVTLTPNFLTSTALPASVSVMANGLTAVKAVTFVPPQASSTECNTSQSWKSCGAFSITTRSTTIPQAVKQLPVIGGVGNALLSPVLDDYPISLYSLGPSCPTDTCKTSFTNNLLRQFGITVPTGYLATQVMILEVPLISILDNTICHHADVVIPFTNVVIGTIDIGCLNIPATNNGVQWAWGFNTTLAGVTPYIQLTRAGSLDLVLTFSTNPNAASTLDLFELGSQMAQLLISLVKHSQSSFGKIQREQQTIAKALQTIATALSGLAESGDVTLGVITSDLSTVGVLSSYSVFDFDDFANSVSLALNAAAIVVGTASSNPMLTVAVALMTAAIHLGTGDVPALLIQVGRCVLDTVNLATQFVVSQPPLSDNWVAQGIAAAFGIVVSIIDPMSSTVVPSYYDSRGRLILGYNVTSGTTILRNSSGVLFATNDTYYAYVFGGGDVTVRLNTIGTRGVLVPYELEAYDTERVVSTLTRYTGLLEVGANIDVNVNHDTSDGSVVPQLSVIPTVQVVGNQVFVIPFLTNGTKVSAGSAFVFAGSQVYQMDQVNSTLFRLDLSPAQTERVLAVYVVVNGFVGGYATIDASPSIGSLKVTVSGPSGPIGGATVMIVSGPSVQMLPALATTEADGTVAFANLAPGTYTYKVAASGYEDKQVTATVIAGQTQSSQASLTQVQQTPSQPSVDYTLYAGLVVLLVALLGVFLALRRRRVTKES